VGRITPIAIALGSNLGDRAIHLDYAVFRLRQLFDDVTVSSYYETAPVDVVGEQPDFLNAAATARTNMTARASLDAVLSIEAERGRERPHPAAARTLDLDLILFGDEVIDEPPTLIVPHPRFRERRFVLAPLAEIAPDWTDPVTRVTIARLLAEVPP